MQHYVVDSYAHPAVGQEPVRTDSRAIKASSDTHAIREAQLVAPIVKAAFFTIRLVNRSGHRVIYDSRSPL
jgi:hypothetical protein